jgi:hypothetical protein
VREIPGRRRGCYIDQFADPFGAGADGLPPPGAANALSVNKPAVAFPGVRAPSSDFQGVRDGRRALFFYMDVDLSAARSIAAGTLLNLDLNGNFLYVDQRQNTGFATLHFQDENPAATPITMFAGALWKVPFTRVGIENTAQPGQTLRLIYGVDVDALPISAAGVTVLNALNINDQVNPSCQVAYVQGALTIGGNQVTNVVPAANNPRGLVLRKAELGIAAGAGGSVYAVLIAALAAPVSIIGSQANAHSIIWGWTNTAGVSVINMPFSQRSFPANWGIWIINTINVAAAPNCDARLSFEAL